ncbi:Uncharacterised protein [Vibrio cholerae]|nr:Uncharacterised protein [Vibrio cholerae]
MFANVVQQLLHNPIQSDSRGIVQLLRIDPHIEANRHTLFGKTHFLHQLTNGMF